MSDATQNKVLTDLTTVANGAEHEFTLSPTCALRVSQVEPFRAEMSRLGRRFSISPGVIANYQVPKADFPTTNALYALWNGEATGGKSYVIEQIACVSGSGTLGLGMSIIAAVTKTPQSSAVSAGTGTVGPASLSGSAQTSAAVMGNNITLADAAPCWTVVASRDQVSAVSVGSGLVANVDGLFIVRPGCCLGLNVFAPTGTTAKFGFNVIWSELQLSNVN